MDGCGEPIGLWQLEFREQWEMIGGNQSLPCPVQGKAFETEALIEVEVVQVQKWNQARIGTAAAKLRSEIDRAVSLGHQAGCQAARPLVEISHNQRRPREILWLEDAPHEPPRLMAALEKTGSEVNVEDVQHAVRALDVSAEAATALAVFPREVVVSSERRRHARQRGIPITPAAKTAVFAEVDSVSAKEIRNESSLIFFGRTACDR